MTRAMAAVGIAVGGTSLIYLVLTRWQNRTRKRRWSGDSSGDGNSDHGGNGGSGHGWVGGDHSALDGSGNPIDTGSGDSGGGGDSGGDGGEVATAEEAVVIDATRLGKNAGF